jgi:hypothetical protein
MFKQTMFVVVLVDKVVIRVMVAGGDVTSVRGFIVDDFYYCFCRR